MPNLSIKNVPAELVSKLRERARANHRSLQGELLALVSQATSEPVAVDGGPTRHVHQGHKSIEQIAAEHRARVEQPIRKGGRSVELIRKERDAR
jgi:hypothetical protein